MKQFKLKHAAIMAFMLGLTACGGGGSSSSTQYPVDSAISAYVQMPHSYTLHASAGSKTYTDNITVTPGPQASFEGTSAFSYSFSTDVTLGNTTPYKDQMTIYVLLSPFKRIGEVDQNGMVTVFTGQQKLPDLAKIGQSGTLDKGTTYANASYIGEFVTYVDGIISYDNGDWFLDSGNNGRAHLCIKLTSWTIHGPNYVTNCYIIDSGGNVLGLTVAMTLNNTDLLFK